MSRRSPQALLDLLGAMHGAERDAAWAAFLDAYSGLLLHVIRRMTRDPDRIMDAYAFIVGALRENEYRRLRRYEEQGRGNFTTWLVAVARRLCIDEHRGRYGRPQGADTPAWLFERRQLVDIVGHELALHQVESSDEPADVALVARETQEALRRALGLLDVSERLILRLRFEDGLAVPEMARMLGYSSPFTLYRRIEKLLDTLRRELERGGVTDVAS